MLFLSPSHLVHLYSNRSTNFAAWIAIELISVTRVTIYKNVLLVTPFTYMQLARLSNQKHIKKDKHNKLLFYFGQTYDIPVFTAAPVAVLAPNLPVAVRLAIYPTHAGCRLITNDCSNRQGKSK